MNYLPLYTVGPVHEPKVCTELNNEINALKMQQAQYFFAHNIFNPKPVTLYIMNRSAKQSVCEWKSLCLLVVNKLMLVCPKIILF